MCLLKLARGYISRRRQGTIYVSQILNFINIDKLKPLKIVVNCGNGAAEPMLDAIAQALLNENAPLEIIRGAP